MSDLKMLNKIQETEIEILQTIDKICHKHNLVYFGIGGTALGAVRHEGFIPWDDDIDIGMPRVDYEKFLEIAREELPSEYHIQHFTTEKKTPFYFTKIRKNNTKFVEYYIKDHDIHHGIFVDIFPFDNVPKNKIICRIHFRCCRILYQIFLAKSLKTTSQSRFAHKEGFKGYLRKMLHYFLFFIPKVWIYHTLNWAVQLFNNQNADEISHIVRRRLRVFLKDLSPITYLRFNSIEMPVPHNYDSYLKGQFGDYSTLPPEDKRYGHLPYFVEFESEEQR